MLVRNIGSWAGLNFSHDDGAIIELPDDVAQRRIDAGRAEALTDEEIEAQRPRATRPSPDIHPDHVPGADHGGVVSVANPNHRPGLSFADAHDRDVEADVKAWRRRGKGAAAARSDVSLGTVDPSAPAPATLNGDGTLAATTGDGLPQPAQSDSGSGHTASSGDAATADAKAETADAGPDVELPNQPAAAEA